VIDVANPYDPVEVGFNDTLGIAQGVAVSGSYACVAARSAGLRIIDVSSPSSPVEVGACDTWGSAHGVTVSGNHAYLAETEGFAVIDISDPWNPSRVNTYELAGVTSPRSVVVSGSRAYLADACVSFLYPSAALRVIDISVPSSPVELGSFDTAGAALSVAVSRGHVYIADKDAGLAVFDDCQHHIGTFAPTPP
jgi:hypothetical protein